MSDPRFEGVSTADVTALMLICAASNDQSDQEFAHAAREELKRREPDKPASAVEEVEKFWREYANAPYYFLANELYKRACNIARQLDAANLRAEASAQCYEEAVESREHWQRQADTARAENETLRKDAERYRYIREKPHMLLHLKNSEFDAAIDLAMSDRKANGYVRLRWRDE